MTRFLLKSQQRCVRKKTTITQDVCFLSLHIIASHRAFLSPLLLVCFLPFPRNTLKFIKVDFLWEGSHTNYTKLQSHVTGLPTLQNKTRTLESTVDFKNSIYSLNILNGGSLHGVHHQHVKQQAHNSLVEVIWDLKHTR